MKELSSVQPELSSTGNSSHHSKLGSVPIPWIMCDIPDVKPPENFDWRWYNVVSKIKNQKQCGDCYIFAGTAVMETQAIMAKYKFDFKTWKPVPKNHFHLNEQTVLNCLPSGCDGGWPFMVYQDFRKRGAEVVKKNDYYSQKVGECSAPKGEPVKALAYCNQLSNNPIMSDDHIKKLIYGHGPISVGINANRMQYVQNGQIPVNFDCDNRIGHAVTLIGWRKDKWIIKNSWGEHFGDKGYLHLPMGMNKCGVNQQISTVYV